MLKINIIVIEDHFHKFIESNVSRPIFVAAGNKDLSFIHIYIKSQLINHTDYIFGWNRTCMVLIPLIEYFGEILSISVPTTDRPLDFAHFF